MRKPATLIGDVFGSSDALSRLQEHAQRLVRAQRVVDQQVPRAMRGTVAVANLRDGVLVLHVPTPALATRLKMSAESLRNALRDTGMPIEELQVKVRPVQMAPASGLYTAENRTIGSKGRQAFGELTNHIDSRTPLGQALGRFLKRVG
ncbi:MAG: DciA family protein [Rhodocyclaceae bacterium]